MTEKNYTGVLTEKCGKEVNFMEEAAVKIKLVSRGEPLVAMMGSKPGGPDGGSGCTTEQRQQFECHSPKRTEGNN
jgi:hypothetical protein